MEVDLLGQQLNSLCLIVRTNTLNKHNNHSWSQKKRNLMQYNEASVTECHAKLHSATREFNVAVVIANIHSYKTSEQIILKN